jgi:SAM-dependent methyltransferase
VDFPLGRITIRRVFYSLLALVHWGPREASIARAIASLNLPPNTHRIVDVGCGPGWLAATATTAQCSYLGVDPALRQSCDLAQGTIEPLDATTVQERLTKNDIVVLNGVAHYLDDQTLQGLLARAQACTAVVICDHRADPTNHRLNRLLQRLDKGHFIRPYAFFETIAGYRTNMLEPFTICPLGIPTWAYFTGLYTASGLPCNGPKDNHCAELGGAS